MALIIFMINHISWYLHVRQYFSVRLFKLHELQQSHRALISAQGLALTI